MGLSSEDIWFSFWLWLGEQHCDKGSVDGHRKSVHMLNTPDKSLLCGTAIQLHPELHHSCPDRLVQLCKPVRNMICSHQCVCEGNSADVQAFISSCMSVLSVNKSAASTNKSTVCYCSRTCVPPESALSGECKATRHRYFPKRAWITYLSTPLLVKHTSNTGSYCDCFSTCAVYH